MSKTPDPVAAYMNKVPRVASLFAFDRPWRVVGRAAIDNEDGGAETDSEIYKGVVITPQGFARLAYHKPTGSVCLFVSKTAVNLRGARQEDGSILARYEGLAKSYIIAARRTSGDPAEFRSIAQELRAELHRFCYEMDQRTRRHFTLFGAAMTDEEIGNGPGEIYTNGCLAYTRLQTENENYSVRFHAPVKRLNGSFVPVRLDEKNFWQRLASSNSIVKTIASGNDHAQSRSDLAQHWQKVSSRLWDEKSIYVDEGPAFAIRKVAADIENSIKNHRNSLIVSGLVGGLAALETQQVEVKAGIAALVASHVVAHYLLERGADGTKHVAELLKKARQRRDIDSYPPGADVSDYFKIKTGANIAKLCPHIDLNETYPHDFEYIQSEYLLPNHDVHEDGLRPSSLRGLLLSAHQRGFSSTCTLPDEATRVDVFQSGLVRQMREELDGKIVIDATYRPEACVLASQRLPREYIEALQGKIVRVEYDRRNPRFSDAFRTEEISLSRMAQETYRHLFDRAATPPASAVKERSIRSVLETFQAPDPENINPKLYMGGQPPRLPAIAAILG